VTQLTDDLLSELTPAEREIAERAEKATPGPWRSMRDGNQYIGARMRGDNYEHCFGASRIDGIKRPWNPFRMIAFGWRPEEMEDVVLKDDDADFVAAARTDVPYLLSVVAKQRKAMKEAWEICFGIPSGGVKWPLTPEYWARLRVLLKGEE
jgi:hypothetical protein